MKKLFYSLLAPAFALVAAAGCYSKPLIPEEVLQLPQHASIRTAYTLWYENPLEMKASNYQKGEIIPFGTNVDILKMTEEEVTFEADGKQFKISVDPSNDMIRMDAFARRLFTTKALSELAGEKTSPVEFEKMIRGIVAPGMTRTQVLAAFGYPASSRTPTLQNDTWVYWVDTAKTKRVVFKKDKVIDLIVLE